MRNSKHLIAAAAIFTMTTAAYADGHGSDWSLDPALSSVSFGSIKNDYIGESHSFGAVSGSVSAEGVVEIALGLASVETLIDIRNERMVEHVFQNATEATITSEIDMAALTDLAVGDATTVETFGTLNLLGTETDVDANLFVMRLSDDKVMVTSDGMLMLSTEDAGIDTGIDVLQELAGLDSITRVSPITLRLIFTAGS